MVGVAGRSKGCNTCKKRKIACGSQRPQCAQCIRSSRLCTGYQRETIFIVNQDYGPCRKTGKANSHDANAKHEIKPTFDPSPETNGATTIRPAWKKRRPMKTMILPSEPSPMPAYREQLLDTFIRGHVPVEQLGRTEQRTWLHELADLSNKPPVLTTAILCISTARLAKKKADQALTQESLSLYTTGLWQLQKALWDPEQMYTDATLAACLLLSLYELYECPAGERGGYISHCDGCARLVQLRGPEAHQDGFAHTLFLAVRMQSILQALDRHVPTFLTEDEWVTVPWKTQPRTLSDRLWDHLALAPGIFAITDRADSMTPVGVLTIVLNIIDICWKMDADLQDFYSALEASIPGPLYWPKLSTMSNPTDDEVNGKVFPVAFDFFNLKMALTLMLYWSTLTMMHNGLVLLYGVMQTVSVTRQSVSESKDAHPLLLKGIPGCRADCICKGSGCLTLFDMTKLPLLGSRTDIRTPARNVCQSVEFCMQPSMLDFGPSSVVTPLCIAIDTIQRDPVCEREVLWGKNVLLEIEDLLPYMKVLRLAKESAINR